LHSKPPYHTCTGSGAQTYETSCHHQQKT
jgi:hypothetical protein